MWGHRCHGVCLRVQKTTWILGPYISHSFEAGFLAHCIHPMIYIYLMYFWGYFASASRGLEGYVKEFGSMWILGVGTLFFMIVE